METRKPSISKSRRDTYVREEGAPDDSSGAPSHDAPPSGGARRAGLRSRRSQTRGGVRPLRAAPGAGGPPGYSALRPRKARPSRPKESRPARPAPSAMAPVPSPVFGMAFLPPGAGASGLSSLVLVTVKPALASPVTLEE